MVCAIEHGLHCCWSSVWQVIGLIVYTHAIDLIRKNLKLTISSLLLYPPSSPPPLQKPTQVWIWIWKVHRKLDFLLKTFPNLWIQVIFFLTMLQIQGKFFSPHLNRHCLVKRKRLSANSYPIISILVDKEIFFYVFYPKLVSWEHRTVCLSDWLTDWLAKNFFHSNLCS